MFFSLNRKEPKGQDLQENSNLPCAQSKLGWVIPESSSGLPSLPKLELWSEQNFLEGRSIASFSKNPCFNGVFHPGLSQFYSV